MLKSRDQVEKNDIWNISTLYPSLSDWEQDFSSFIPSKEAPHWPALASFQNRLHEGPENFKNALELIMTLDRHLTKLYTYAHLRHDEDITDTECKMIYEKVVLCAHQLAQESSWFQPEILSLSDDLLNEYLNHPLLKTYHFYLEKMIRLKKHTLSSDQEKLIALAGQAMQTPHKAFSAINDADFNFGSVLDSQNEEKSISHATYALYIRNSDRTLRERAFKKYHSRYKEFENSLCELLSGQIQSHLFTARSRHYSSCLEAALYPKNIDSSIYHALIEAVNKKLPSLHRYMELRKKVLGLEEQHLYDIYIPLIPNVDIKFSYDEAEEAVIDSVAPLGVEYQKILHEGLKKNRWVDRYENKNKRSGAYSSGCFDSMPFILMNYKGVIRDVFTLAHEAGHSMHSWMSRHAQPYHYSDYPIFLAEVASTFNEDLLTQHLLKKFTTPAERIFLLNQKIEDIRGTLFRQTMFAEFELMIHQKIEQGIPLTPQLLKSEYRELNKRYFGPSVIIDEEIDVEWARIPHFYYNFYVFQYATGISAALALSHRVVNGGDNERNEYLNFLKAGSSLYPIEILKMAGINMESPAPVISALETFDRLIDELETLLLADKKSNC
jgi:oligoendopeptidase F